MSTVAAPGELVLTLTSQIGRCAAGATGDYRWTVSAQTTTLTLEAIDDECPDRAAALAGTWTHTACPTRGNDCLGFLEAGTYRSVNFDPFDTDSYGQVTYTVPDGWTSTLDDKGRLELLPPDANEQGAHGVFLFADVAPTTSDCLATPLATVGKLAIADSITETPGLVTSTAVTEVGGYEAQAIDITATDLVCDGEQPLLASRPGAETSWTSTIGDGQQMRIVLVDLADDRTLALVISSDRTTSEYAALLDASTAVIDSMVFVRHALSVFPLDHVCLTPTKVEGNDMTNRRHRIVIIATALSAVLGACGSDADTAAPATDGGEVAPAESTEHGACSDNCSHQRRHHRGQHCAGRNPRRARRPMGRATSSSRQSRHRDRSRIRRHLRRVRRLRDRHRRKPDGVQLRSGRHWRRHDRDDARRRRPGLRRR